MPLRPAQSRAGAVKNGDSASGKEGLTMNIFDLPELLLAEELTTVLAEGDCARIERIVSTGQISDWYDQAETEFIVLLEGSAVIEYDNGHTLKMKKGDTLLVTPHEKHRVSFTSSATPCVWLCVFYGK